MKDESNDFYLALVNILACKSVPGVSLLASTVVSAFCVGTVSVVVTELGKSDEVGWSHRTHFSNGSSTLIDFGTAKIIFRILRKCTYCGFKQKFRRPSRFCSSILRRLKIEPGNSQEHFTGQAKDICIDLYYFGMFLDISRYKI